MTIFVIPDRVSLRRARALTGYGRDRLLTLMEPVDPEKPGGLRSIPTASLEKMRRDKAFTIEEWRAATLRIAGEAP
jgi:hypothetical protein